MGGSLAKLLTAKVCSGELKGWLPMAQRACDGESDVRGIPMCDLRLCVMEAVIEPCTVKLTYLEESNQCSSGARR